MDYIAQPCKLLHGWDREQLPAILVRPGIVGTCLWGLVVLEVIDRMDAISSVLFT
jgi:hypothetical protein